MLLSRAASMNRGGVRQSAVLQLAWGVWGLLLVVPMMVIKAVCDHVEPLHPVSHMLDD